VPLSYLHRKQEPKREPRNGFSASFAEKTKRSKSLPPSHFRRSLNPLSTVVNHGTWYDVQVAAYALFVGREDVACKVLSQVPARRTATQIEPDGSQPFELARTKSFSYSLMNLRGMFDLATLGERVGVDLWSFQTDDGRSIRKALDWLIPYATGEKKWQHKQITTFAPAGLVPLLRRAAVAYGEPRYEQLIARLAHGDRRADRVHLLYPRRDF
jgi:hypothetical protein